MENIHAITHIEIPAPDLNRAIEFYSKVFGWKIESMLGADYSLFKIGDTNSGGAFDASAKPAADKTGPGLVINVDDIPLKLKEIEKAGGKTIQEKTEIAGGYGFYARFQDPNGNFMQLYSGK